MEQIEPRASNAWDKEGSGDLYDKHRPMYHAQTIAFINSLLTKYILNEDNYIKKDKFTIVELGAGTGKLTRSFFKHNTKDILNRVNYIATEPIQKLSCKITDNASGDMDKVNIIACTASEAPFDNCSVDAVICAQCFHWFATDKALSNIHRILKPNGLLVLVWNHIDDGHSEDIHNLHEIFEQGFIDKNVSLYGSNLKWQEVFDCNRTLFEALQHQIQYVLFHKGNKEHLVNYFKSHSSVDAQVLGNLSKYLATMQQDEDGLITIPLKTRITYTTRL